MTSEVWGCGATFEVDAVFYDASQQTVIVVGFCMNYCPVNHLIQYN